MIKTYYLLTKPGIIMGNMITVLAGFALASSGGMDYSLMLLTTIGLGLVIASACVFNNYIDRMIDRKMERTKNRPLAQGTISPRRAIYFGTLLGAVGISILCLFTNILTVLVALAGFFIYVFVYSLGKPKTMYATLIGSISGGVPPVVGYCAVSNRFDWGATIFFVMLVLWQMPHFFAIAIYRFEDYLAASIPTLPNKRSAFVTKLHMLFYVIAFTATAAMLSLLGYTGTLYLIAAFLLGAIWVALCLKGFKAKSDKVWARKMFAYSLLNITALCILIYPSGW